MYHDYGGSLKLFADCSFASAVSGIILDIPVHERSHKVPFLFFEAFQLVFFRYGVIPLLKSNKYFCNQCSHKSNPLLAI